MLTTNLTSQKLTVVVFNWLLHAVPCGLAACFCLFLPSGVTLDLAERGLMGGYFYLQLSQPPTFPSAKSRCGLLGDMLLPFDI